jgi:N-acetylglutamate synthase-like GNAT family acetyltransferase
MSRLVVRNAYAKDLQRVAAFLAEQDNPYLSPRKDADLIKAIENKRVTLIETAHGALVGVGAVFEYLDGEYRELGALKVAESHQRRGLQRLIQAALILHEVALDPGYERLFAIVHETNTGSIENLERSGFKRWDPPAQNIFDVKAGHFGRRPDDVPEYKWYYVPNNVVPQRAHELNNCTRNRMWPLPPRQPAWTLEFDLEIVNRHQPVLDTLERGEFDGDFDLDQD